MLIINVFIMLGLFCRPNIKPNMIPNIELIVYFCAFSLIKNSIFWGKTLDFGEKFCNFASYSETGNTYFY